MNIAIFPGSFDPFTIGHADIVKRALPLFDQIVIAIGLNIDKQPAFPLEQRVERIKAFFAAEPKVSVITYTNLTVDAARELDANYIIRGVRNVADFEYEKNMADANLQLSGIETLIFFTQPQLAHISSSLIRDLHKHGKDITPYIV